MATKVENMATSCARLLLTDFSTGRVNRALRRQLAAGLICVNLPANPMSNNSNVDTTWYNTQKKTLASLAGIADSRKVGAASWFQPSQLDVGPWCIHLELYLAWHPKHCNAPCDAMWCGPFLRAVTVNPGDLRAPWNREFCCKLQRFTASNPRNPSRANCPNQRYVLTKTGQFLDAGAFPHLWFDDRPKHLWGPSLTDRVWGIWQNMAECGGIYENTDWVWLSMNMVCLSQIWNMKIEWQQTFKFYTHLFQEAPSSRTMPLDLEQVSWGSTGTCRKCSR